MNTKLLCVAILFLTGLIFWGNYSAASNEIEPPAACEPCNCQVVMLQMHRSKKIKEPSCSVVFRVMRKLFNFRVESGGGPLSAPPLDVTACDFSVFCDPTHIAAVTCDNFSKEGHAVDPGQKCTVKCEKNLLRWHCDNWQRKQTKKIKKSPSSPDTTVPPSWMVLDARNMGGPLVSDFGSDGYTHDDQDEAKDIITGATRWRLIEGEAGMEKGELTVANGEAEAQSFCTGDKIRLTGPGAVSLPTCPVDITGRWQGDYTRRPLKKEPLAITLDLRLESYALRGELKTPDGTFNITSARQNDTGFQLEAGGMVDGTERKFSLNGKITKGDIVFDGAETGFGAKPLRLIGAVKRLYIADSGVPPGVVNQPYSFTLTGVSPEEGGVNLRLASGRLPRGVNFDASSGTLSGTPGEVGSFKFAVAATDAAGNMFEQPLTLNIKKMAITTRLLPDAFYGQPYSATLTVAGGQPPYRFTGFPPKGLTLDVNTGVISGTPTSSRHESSPFTVRDSQNNSDSEGVRLRVRTTTILTSHFLPEASQGVPYRMQFVRVGNNIATQWMLSEGDLEMLSSIGLKLDRLTGELSGTPTKAGAFWLSMGAITTSSDQQYRNFALTIKAK